MLTEKQIKKLQRNQKYWGNRLEEIQEEIQNSNGIKNVYRKAYAQMEKELLALHSEVIKNEGKITRTQLYRLKHYKELMRQIREMSKTVSTDVNSAIFETLENAYTQTFTELAEVIDASDFDLVDKKQASSIVNTKFYGEHFSDRVWANTNAIASRMKNDIIDACIKGVSRDRLVKAIKNDFDVAFYKADRIVRTETMRVLNQASLEKYKEFGATKVKWLTSSGACDICRKFKDKIFDIDDVPPIAHPNCKCTQIPIIDDEVSENTANNTTKSVDNSVKSGIIETGRGVSTRNMANAMRKPHTYILTDNEIESIKSDIRAIGADESIFRFNSGDQTSYNEKYDIIFVRGDVLPDTNSLHPRDLMSSRAVIAHEYYGHRAFRGTKLEKESWNDEFRASYMAAKNTPNLSNSDRRYLILDALERAKEKGVSVRHNDFIRRVLYG